MPTSNNLIIEFVNSVNKIDRTKFLEAYDILYENPKVQEQEKLLLESKKVYNFLPLIYSNYSDCYIGIYNEKLVLITNELLFANFSEKYYMKEFEDVEYLFQQIILPDIE